MPDRVRLKFTNFLARGRDGPKRRVTRNEDHHTAEGLVTVFLLFVSFRSMLYEAKV